VKECGANVYMLRNFVNAQYWISAVRCTLLHSREVKKNGQILLNFLHHIHISAYSMNCLLPANNAVPCTVYTSWAWVPFERFEMKFALCFGSFFCRSLEFLEFFGWAPYTTEDDAEMADRTAARI
jgi:hypothetical protein